MNIQSSRIGHRRKVILSLLIVMVMLGSVAGVAVMTKGFGLGATGGCVQSYHRDSTTRAYTCS